MGGIYHYLLSLILCLTCVNQSNLIHSGFPQLQMLPAPQLWRTLPGTGNAVGAAFPTAGKSQLFGWNLLNQHNMTHHKYFTNETEVMIGPTGSYNQRNILPTTTNQLLNLHQRHCDVLVWLSKSRFHCLQASWMLRSWWILKFPKRKSGVCPLNMNLGKPTTQQHPSTEN